MKGKNAYVHFNQNRLMPENSNMCGQYTVYWLLERYRNIDLEYAEFCCLLSFKSDVNENDEIVSKYMKNEIEHAAKV